MLALRENALNAYAEALVLDDEPGPDWLEGASKRAQRNETASGHWHKCSELLPFLNMFIRHIDATCAYIARQLSDPRAMCPSRPVVPLAAEICPKGRGTLEAAHATRAAFEANDASLWAIQKTYIVDLATHALVAIRELGIPWVREDQ